MSKPDLRSFFAENYPHLTNEELDTCCTNMRAFVKVVLAIMEHNEKLNDKPETRQETDSTL